MFPSLILKCEFTPLVTKGHFERQRCIYTFGKQRGVCTFREQRCVCTFGGQRCVCTALWYNKELIVVQIYLLILYYKRYVSLWRYYMKCMFLRMHISGTKMCVHIWRTKVCVHIWRRKGSFSYIAMAQVYLNI